MDAAVVANVIAGMALIGALVGWLSNRRQAKSAEAEALRATIALERMVQVMERREEAAERAAGTPGVAWRVEPLARGSFVLTNTGRGIARDVQVQFPHGVWGHFPETSEMGPGEQRKLIAEFSLAASDDIITVTWSDPDSVERHNWARPLPPTA